MDDCPVLVLRYNAARHVACRKGVLHCTLEEAAMAIIVERRYTHAIHPFHAVVLAGLIPWFLGATLSDVAYARSFEIQWSNFASWFLVGGLVFGGVALVCALIGLFRADRRATGGLFYFLVLLAAWVVGFFSALMHARDAWAMMPGGLVLSAVTLLLVLVATWLGFRSPHAGVTI